jgi:hypothetical protein
MHKAVRLMLPAFAAFVLVAVLPAWASGPPSGVVSAIEKKYVVTETTGDGEQITKDGTTMAMKCAGVYSLPTSAFVKPDIKVVDGKVQKLNPFLSATMSNQGAHVLQTGDKVYITKIESKGDSKNDELKFTLLTVDSLDVKNSDAKKKFQATVSFKFKKGYLDEAPPDDVEQTIEAVLAPDTGSDDAKGGDNTAAAPAPAKAAAAPPARVAPAAPVAAAPAAPPPTISIGESSTEVLQAMGMPLQMIDLGKKKTYVYKDMKITFVNDKVSDMQ